MEKKISTTCRTDVFWSLKSRSESEKVNYPLICAGETGRDIFSTFNIINEENKNLLTTYYDSFDFNDWKKEQPATVVVFNRVFLPPRRLPEHYVTNSRSRYQHSHHGPFLIHVAESTMHCVTADSLYTTNFLVWISTSFRVT